jgi:mannose-6-phosphate isomerase-like protein (cupin superfamily)
MKISHLIPAFLIVSLVLILLLETVSTGCSEEYVYYAVIPSRIYYAEPRRILQTIIDPTYGFEIDPRSIATSALVSIVASQDDTHVRVYNLSDNNLLDEAELNAMEKTFVRLPNGTRFKVVSNRLVTVKILGGNGEAWEGSFHLIGELDPSIREGPTSVTFYTSTDGYYVGKEFVFVASQRLIGTPYKIRALEDAEVTITSEGGVEKSFTLQANTYRNLALESFKAYKVKSTGNIMVQSGAPSTRSSRSFYVPSVKGGFVGRVFYSSSITNWDPIEDSGFVILALEDANVAIWDVKMKRVIQKFEIREGGRVAVKPKAEEIMVESDKLITFAFVHNGSYRGDRPKYGAGVAFIGVRPNEETIFFLPTNSSVQVYIFSYEDAQVKIDDVPITVKADSFFLLTSPGTHKITSDKNIVIEVIHWPLYPSIQGIVSFSVAVPCIQTVNLTPNVSLTPLLKEGFPMSYIAIGVGVVIAVVALGFIMMKRRTK